LTSTLLFDKNKDSAKIVIEKYGRTILSVYTGDGMLKIKKQGG